MKQILTIMLMLLAATQLRATDKAKPVISILGDSYSTFENYIPEGNASWYATTPWENRTDVVDVKIGMEATDSRAIKVIFLQ